MRSLRLSLALLLALAGCAAPTGGDDAPYGGPVDDDPSLSDVDALLMGAPDNSELPSEGKADDVYPERFDLAMAQSPVRSQESRGVCSIFSTVALMEHLYIAEGTVTTPDFSEQFLQWSTKFEVGDFPNTSGSNARTNLDAINRFGIPEEQAWPYEGTEWSTSNDPECTGESMPTRCYTNGSPPESALAARRFHLPRGRWINSGERSIKGHMVNENTGVVVGLTFFYQSWNHRRSMLPTSQEYFRNGYVLSPNAEDRRISLEKRAGHSILLMGWDDNLSVQKRDKDGTPMVDADGNPVMETGFFLFKNSWGTASFGVDNEFGAGYGWISYEYVREHGSAYISGLPQLATPEICNDENDNDMNGSVDCADAACASDPSCMMPTGGYENTTAFPIPDDDPNGIRSEIAVPDGGAIMALSVTASITHTYRGDLRVVLVRDGREVVLHDREGGGEDNLSQTWSVDDFNGDDGAGTWVLSVSDHAGADTGTLESWSIEITR